MTAGCILLLYVVRKLGLVEMENDQLRASQQALLRQVGLASTGQPRGIQGQICACSLKVQFAAMLQVNQMQSHYEGKETGSEAPDAAESPDAMKVRPPLSAARWLRVTPFHAP